MGDKEDTSIEGGKWITKQKTDFKRQKMKEKMKKIAYPKIHQKNLNHT